jgi:hypothetical protein
MDLKGMMVYWRNFLHQISVPAFASALLFFISPT